MATFSCTVCHSALSADPEQAGQLVRCPTCLNTLRVPSPKQTQSTAATGRTSDAAESRRGASSGVSTVTAPPPVRGTGKRYGFNCAYCSSRLEATESVAAQEGVCPTCGNSIVIPILDRYGRLIDPRTQQIIKQDPHPVHAYAAAGERAPRILRTNDNQQFIQCPRCSALNAINANNCKPCGMPFTMEGTTLEATGASNGLCVSSLVLGIIGLPCNITVIIPLLAIILGIIGYLQVTQRPEASGKGLAITGSVFGVIGCFIAMARYL